MTGQTQLSRPQSDASSFLQTGIAVVTHTHAEGQAMRQSADLRWKLMAGFFSNLRRTGLNVSALMPHAERMLDVTEASAALPKTGLAQSAKATATIESAPVADKTQGTRPGQVRRDTTFRRAPAKTM